MRVISKRLFFFMVFFVTLLNSSYALNKGRNYKYEIALCAIFQNEAEYLPEWIEFHKLVGVQHFYLFNNLSNDHYREVLQKYVDNGEVELFDWDYQTCADGSNWPAIQMHAYNDCLKLAKNVTKWLAIIDTDEFIFPVQVKTLTEFLKDYENYPAVCVNWQMYGTSWVKEIHPDQLLIDKLIFKAPKNHGENVHVKSIVRPEFVEKINNPHFCKFLPGYYQVNSNKEPFEGPFSNVMIDKIRINHYWTRDEKFFYSRKIARRSLWNDGDTCILRNTNLNKEVDLSIRKYSAELKKALGIN